MAQDKRLWFTSSTSTKLPIQDGTAYTGLYQCQLEDDHCTDPHTIANGWQRDGRFHYGISLYNLQFVSTNDEHGNERRYVYARTYVEEHKSFEILRALMSPSSGSAATTTTEPVDDRLHFQTFFRSDLQFDFNTCDFDCCDAAKGHAYTLITPKTFVVAENGNVFVAWDGFYKNCNDIASKRLQWTIGISKLNTTDSSCMLPRSDDTEKANFVECTEPVAIVYQSVHGRSVTMPHGGLAILEPLTELFPPKRIFFLSVLKSSGEVGEGSIQNDLWAFPENGQYNQDPNLLQTLSTITVNSVFFDEVVEDGGTIRLHRTPASSESTEAYVDPRNTMFHLCRSVFNSGIECLDFEWSANTEIVTMLNEPAKFLTLPQVQSFCKLQDSSIKSKHRSSHFERVTTVATGFDVMWNNQDGSPERIFFGCWGNEGGNGNFGSVNATGTLVQTLTGAYPGSILLLTTFRQTSNQNAPQSQFGCITVGLVSIIVCAAARIKMPRRRTAATEDDCAPIAYYELPTRDLKT